jgi:vacuolar-type H+-ATPase subunit E/Vma4
MTHQIYNAISKTELELLTFRGNVVKDDTANQFVVEWHDEATLEHPEKKVTVEVLYENGGIVASVLTQEEASDGDVKELMDTFLEKLECDIEQMDVDWQAIPDLTHVTSIPMLSG